MWGKVLSFVKSMKFTHIFKLFISLHTSHSETCPGFIGRLNKATSFLAHSTGTVAPILKDELPECFISNLKKYG